MEDRANSIIAAMRTSGVERLVFVLSMGIYDEAPGKFGEWNHARLADDLKPLRRAADAIEASNLTFTIVRPAWMTDEVDYELTTRHSRSARFAPARQLGREQTEHGRGQAIFHVALQAPAPSVAIAAQMKEIAFAIGELAKWEFSQIHP